MVCKNGNIRTVYNASQHYINDASICASLPHAWAFIRKNMALGQVVTKIVGHVDPVWEMKQVYTRITLKPKYITIHGVNHWNSLKGNLRNSVSSGITILYLINYFPVSPTVTSAHVIDLNH